MLGVHGAKAAVCQGESSQAELTGVLDSSKKWTISTVTTDLLRCRPSALKRILCPSEQTEVFNVVYPFQSAGFTGASDESLVNLLIPLLTVGSAVQE